MFHPNVSARKSCLRLRLTVPRTVALVVAAALGTAAHLQYPRSACGAKPAESQIRASEPKKDAGRDGSGAEAKLLASLEAAILSRADHYDSSRLDRELSAAFRDYGLDLDTADPKTAGTRLAGHRETPAIAAALDRWCYIRRETLKVDSWRRLTEIARAADPDPWRNALRGQLGKPTSAVLPALKATHRRCSGAGKAAGRQLAAPGVDARRGQGPAGGRRGLAGCHATVPTELLDLPVPGRPRDRGIAETRPCRGRSCRSQRRFQYGRKARWPTRIWQSPCTARGRLPMQPASSTRRSG